MKKLTSIILSLALLLGVLMPFTVSADSIKQLTEIGKIEVDEEAGYGIRFTYGGKEYSIEYPDMDEDDLSFVLEVFSDDNLVLSDNQDADVNEDGFFDPVSRDVNVNYFFKFDSELVHITAVYPFEDGIYEGIFEYRDKKIYDKLIEYLYALVKEDGKPTEKEDTRENLVNITDFDILYSGEFYIEDFDDYFEWGLCTYNREGEKEAVTTFYFKFGETKNEEYFFVSDEVDRVRNTVIFNLTDKSGRQVTLEKRKDVGVEFDQAVSYLYDYKIKVNLNGKKAAKDMTVSYKHKDDDDYTKEIIDMEEYKQSGKLQSEMFANNFAQDLVESGKTEVEIDYDNNAADKNQDTTDKNQDTTNKNQDTTNKNQDTTNKKQDTTDKKQDTTDETPYNQEVSVLKSLGIIEGYTDGSFKSEETLTRAEAAAIIVRLINKDAEAEPADTEFTDVKKDHWASGCINVAAEEGIINGRGDQTFAPEEKVTYHQFVKMLVCALGYEPMAELHGSWAGLGYIFTGAKIGLTKGIEARTDEFITREKMARLVFKSLTIDLMEEIEPASDTNGKTHTIAENKCVLTEYLGYQKVEGFILESDEACVTLTVKRNYAEEPYFEDGQTVKFAASDKNVQNLVNENVIAYVTTPGEGIETEDAFIAIVEKME